MNLRTSILVATAILAFAASAAHAVDRPAGGHFATPAPSQRFVVRDPLHGQHSFLTQFHGTSGGLIVILPQPQNPKTWLDWLLAFLA